MLLNSNWHTVSQQARAEQGAPAWSYAAPGGDGRAADSYGPMGDERVTDDSADAGAARRASRAADRLAESLGTVAGTVHDAVTETVAGGKAGIAGVAATVRGVLGPIAETVLDTVSETAAKVDGRSSRWDAHRAARREELIDAAIAAISRHGAGVGMDQIAAEAGTSKPVLYRYFADRSALHRAVSRRIIAEVADTLVATAAGNPPPRALMASSVDAYLAVLESKPEIFRFLAIHHVFDPAVAGSKEDFSAATAALLGELLGGYLAEQGRDPGLAHPWAEGVVGFIRAASLWWLDHRATMTRQQLAEYLSDLLWGGAAALLAD